MMLTTPAGDKYTSCT